MEPDVLSKDLSACPRCGAGVRADAPWCTQCFLDLRTPAAVPPVPPAPPVPAQPVAPEPRAAERPPYAPPTGLDPLTAPLHVLLGEPAPEPEPVRPGWPCAACGTANGFELDACGACGEGFLAGLAASGGPLVLPGVGDLTVMSKRKRTSLAFGVVLAMMALVALLGLLLG